MKQIYLIDGNSLLFRAYYATSYPGAALMKTRDGLPTNAVNAFANMINGILTLLPKGEGLFVGFDTGHKTFRHEQFKEYKAQRKEAPEELITQMPYAREFLSSLNIKQAEIIGYEGDDIIGTLAKIASKQGIKAVIFTSDRDFLQLVDDNITVEILKSGLKERQTFTIEEVIAQYGIHPDQMIDYKALCGDSSDNYKGVPGIGPKTAQNLLNTYGTFENIVANAEKINGKCGKALIESYEEGVMSKMLATISLDVPIDFSLEDCVYEGYDYSIASSFLKKLEMFNFLKRLNTNYRLNFEVADTDSKIKLINSFSELPSFKELSIFLNQDEGNYHEAVIRGLAISLNQQGYYITYEALKTDEAFKNIVQNPEILINTYDLKKFNYMLLTLGIELEAQGYDLLLAHYLLESVAVKNIDAVLLTFNTEVTATYQKVKEDDQINTPYSCEIALAIEKSIKVSKERIDEVAMSSLLFEIEIPLSITLSKMEYEGFPIDVNVLDSFRLEYESKIRYNQEKAFSMVGHQFNLASPKQVAEVLFDELGLPENKKRSTGSDHLKYLLNTHPIIEIILEYRKYAKLLSTYVESLTSHIKDDGKIHTIFNQAITTTGRLSSQEPNVQNITIRDEEGRQIRKAFYYPNGEYLILSLDYSNVELRVLASLANCTTLIEAFNNGRDIHLETASKVFKTDEPTSLQRRQAKAVTFGIVYGISDWGLADQLGIEVGLAQQMIVQFYEAYPEIAVYLNEISQNAQINGYVETLFKRRRYLRDLYDRNYHVREAARRAALNAPIQGTAADIIKISMIEVDKALRNRNLSTRMVLQIHDELVFKVPLSESEEVESLIRDIMENSVKLAAKLEVGGGLGKTWFDVK